MGCTSGKQLRSSGHTDVDSHASPVKITKQIKKVVKQLEKYFEEVKCTLKEKSQYQDIHSPADLIRYLRSCKSLTNEYVNEIEQEFLIYFNDMKQLMQDVNSILTDTEIVKQMSKNKINKLLKFIQTYDNTCSQFFQYRQEFQYKILLKGQIEVSQKFSKRLSTNTLQVSNNSATISTRTNIPKAC